MFFRLVEYIFSVVPSFYRFTNSFLDACGVGRCIDTENSFECQCPLGRAGRSCEREITINEPAFRNDAYIAYPSLKPARRLKFSMKVKPNGHEDGILLYSSETDEGHGDFISLAARDKHLEFRFDAGNGKLVNKDEILDVFSHFVGIIFETRTIFLRCHSYSSRR